MAARCGRRPSLISPSLHDTASSLSTRARSRPLGVQQTSLSIARRRRPSSEPRSRGAITIFGHPYLSLSARQLRPHSSASALGSTAHDDPQTCCTLHPKKTLFASSKILSPCLISLLEYHERKNLPFSVRYVPLSLKNWVFSGVSLYSPASSGNSHSGWPAFAAAALKSASRGAQGVYLYCERGGGGGVLLQRGEVNWMILVTAHSPASGLILSYFPCHWEKIGCLSVLIRSRVFGAASQKCQV